MDTFNIGNISTGDNMFVKYTSSNISIGRPIIVFSTDPLPHIKDVMLKFMSNEQLTNSELGILKYKFRNYLIKYSTCYDPYYNSVETKHNAMISFLRYHTKEEFIDMKDYDRLNKLIN